MPIDDQKNRIIHPEEETTQKGHKHLRVDSSTYTHKTEIASPSYSRDEVYPETGTCGRDDGCFSTWCPCRTAVGIRTYTPFITKPDLGPDALRLLADTGKLLLEPSFYNLRVLLVGPPERSL